MCNSLCSDIPLEIHLPKEISMKWEELGIEPNQRENDVRSLKITITKIIEDYSTNLCNKCLETKEKVRKIHEMHVRAMSAMGIQSDEIQHDFFDIQQVNLLQQLSRSENSYESFKISYNERLNKFKECEKTINQYFDNLSIPIDERGEFSEIGENDLTLERLNRYKMKIDIIKSEYSSRRNKIQQIKDDISSLQKELCNQMTEDELFIINSQNASDETIKNFEMILLSMKDLKEKRILQLSKYASNITRLWNLLGVPDNERSIFLKKHSTVSESAMMSCESELGKLGRIRDEKMPILMEQQIKVLESMYSNLHIPDSARIVFSEMMPNSEETIKQFDNIENEISRLKLISIEVHPIVSLIQQIDEIEASYKEAIRDHDPKSYTSRDRNSAIQLMKEEKARRRYKVAMPKLKKKLEDILEKYKKKHGSDFEWDGEPYIAKLKAVEEMEKISKRFGNLGNAGTVPPRKKNGKLVNRGNENTNKNQCNKLNGCSYNG